MGTISHSTGNKSGVAPYFFHPPPHHLRARTYHLPTDHTRNTHLANDMSDDASSDGSDAAGPALPAGVLKTRTAWAGDQLEMDHTREHIRRGGADTDADHQASHHAAVDISQFQNTEVGSGYQARHVVRQKTGAGSDGMKVRDMTGCVLSDTKDGGGKRESEKKIKNKSEPVAAKRKRDDDHGKYKVADEYLKCKGVREFRLELEKILSSA